MIGGFLDSWELFGNAYLVGWMIAFALSGIGVWVVARNQIFLGAAVAQASAFGVALALRIGSSAAAVSLPWLASDALHAALAVGASVATALVTSREAHGRESSEAVTGWVFLLASSGAVLLVAHSPHGLEEVKQILLSTLLGVSGTDVWLFAGLALLTGAGIAGLQRSILLFAVDPEMAGAVGMRRGLWKTLTAVWLGVAVGLAIHAAGMLYAFGCLVLPALIAKNLCREMRSVFVLAPLLGVSAAVVGFVLANHYDTPPAHTTVALFCALLAGAWIRRSRRDR